jgi:hypothetical protein
MTSSQDKPTDEWDSSECLEPSSGDAATIPVLSGAHGTLYDTEVLQAGIGRVILPVDALEGRTIKQCYYIEEKIGRGGMAWVYKALHTAFQAPVAVKFLFSEYAGDPDMYEQFLTEARLQFSLKHPNIVQVMDYIDELGLVGCVMEWVDGVSLSTWLKTRGPVPVEETKAIMTPIIKAISFAHQKQVVHCDLKPGNILLHTEDGELVPKVADFGIAKVLGSVGIQPLNEENRPVGSIQTMAPEQIGESFEGDHRADIYSLGVMLYRLLVGAYPFVGSQHHIIMQHLREQPVPPSHHVFAVPSALDQVVCKCLEKEPADRYQSCEELLEALQEACLDPMADTDVMPSMKAMRAMGFVADGVSGGKDWAEEEAATEVEVAGVTPGMLGAERRSGLSAWALVWGGVGCVLLGLALFWLLSKVMGPGAGEQVTVPPEPPTIRGER